MDLALLGGLLASLTSLIGLFFAIFTVRKMNQKLETFEELGQSVGAMFRYEEDDDGNPLVDARLSKMIGMFSSAMARSLKMSMLAGLSGQARLEKGLKGAIASDVVENKMPILNLIGDFMGINTKQYVAKHPDAMMQLAAQFMPMLQKARLGAGSNRAGNDGVGYG